MFTICSSYQLKDKKKRKCMLRNIKRTNLKGKLITLKQELDNLFSTVGNRLKLHENVLGCKMRQSGEVTKITITGVFFQDDAD